MSLHARSQAQLAGLADHCTVAAGIVLGIGPAVGMRQRDLLHTGLGRQHAVPAKAWMGKAGLIEERVVIKIGCGFSEQVPKRAEIRLTL